MTIEKNNIKQFKLTNNEEIVCEVISWPSIDDDFDEVVVRKALKIIAVEDYQRGWRFFAFRPWMTFEDDPNSIQGLNATHIVVTSSPSEAVLRHYKKTLDLITKDPKLNKQKSAMANLDEIQDELRDLTDDEMDDFLERKYGMTPYNKDMVDGNSIKSDNLNTDSDTGNIIRFPKDKTFH